MEVVRSPCALSGRVSCTVQRETTDEGESREQLIMLI